jgi:uncharacterized protein YjcR
MAAPAKIDWFQARQDYLENSTVSYADIAKKYGVSKTAVEARGKNEGWAELRQSLGEKAFSEFQENLLSQKNRAQNDHLKLYQNMRALVHKSIMALHEEGEYERDRNNEIVFTEPDKDGNTHPIKKSFDPFRLEKMAKALQISVNGERTVLGLP